MTKSQNETILTMRRALCGYTQISEKTGLSVGAIKSYCYRNGLNTASLKNSSGFCKNCGKPILNPSKTRPENFAPMPVKQRGGIFIVTTTRTAHQLSNSNVMSAVRSLQISAVRKESCSRACYQKRGSQND